MNQTEITFNTNANSSSKTNVSSRGGGELRKFYSKLFKLIDNFKLIYPESLISAVVIAIWQVITLLSLSFDTRSV